MEDGSAHECAHARRGPRRRACRRYDIEKIWCKGRKSGCRLIPPAGEPPTPRTAAALSALTAAAKPPPARLAAGAPIKDGATARRCEAHARTAAASAAPPVAPAVSNASEVPEGARRVLHRAAARS